MKAVFIIFFAMLSIGISPIYAQQDMVSSNKTIIKNADASQPEHVKNSFSKKIGNVSGIDILKKNIEALGGIQQLNSIQSLDFEGTLNISGTKFNFSERKQIPNLDYIALSVDKDTIMRSVFNGTDGYNQQIGQKKTLSDEEIKERNLDNLGLFNPICYLDSSKSFVLKEISVSTSNDSSFYRLDIQMPSGKTVSEFYDTTSYLLAKSIENETLNGEKVVTNKTFSNYKKINGVQFPFSMAIQKIQNEKEQDISITIESVHINLPTE